MKNKIAREVFDAVAGREAAKGVVG